MKRDINLLPRRKASDSSNKGIIIALAVFLLYVIVFGVALKIPMDLISAVNLVNTQLDSEIANLEPQAEVYDNLVLELAQLQEEINSKEKIEYSDRTIYNALKIIQETCPTGVMIMDFNNSVQAIQLNGVAESDEQVAQFMLNLDRSGEFMSVEFSGTVPYDIIMYDASDNPYNVEGRSFTLVLTYTENVTDDTQTEGEE